MPKSPCDGWVTDWDPSFAAFSLRIESFTLICMYGDCNAILPFTSRKKSRLLVLLFCFRDTFTRISIQMICFSIKLETEWFDIFFPECCS